MSGMKDHFNENRIIVKHNIWFAVKKYSRVYFIKSNFYTQFRPENRTVLYLNEAKLEAYYC